MLTMFSASIINVKHCSKKSQSGAQVPVDMAATVDLNHMYIHPHTPFFK